MDWLTFVSQLALSGATLSAIAWLIKSLVSHQLVRELEIIKVRLAEEADQNRIRFSKLHERRAEIIENLYQRIAHILSRIKTFDAESKDVAQTTLDIETKMIEMAYYFGQHALYFDDGFKAKFQETFLEGMGQSTKIMSFLGAIEPYLKRIEERKRKIGDGVPKLDLKEPIIARLREHIPKMTALAVELEREFQIILGVRKS